jgi:hypothetical protein
MELVPLGCAFVIVAMNLLLMEKNCAQVIQGHAVVTEGK